MTPILEDQIAIYFLDTKQRWLLYVCVLGLARTGLIFTRLQEGAQPGGGG